VSVAAKGDPDPMVTFTGIVVANNCINTPLIDCRKVTFDPGVPVIETVGLLDVSPWSAERVCPEVTGKLPVAFVNGIGPDESEKPDIWAPTVVPFTNTVL
jgi:hypothetical protein